MSTLMDLLEASPKARPFAEGALSFGDLALRAGKVSRALAGEGFGPGDLVGLSAPNSPEWAVAFFGILGSGAAVLPIDPHLKPEEEANLLAQFGCRKVLRAGGLEPSGAGTPKAPKEEALAVLIASSGTTGKPKGVMLSHANLMANVGQFREVLPTGPEDAFLALLPFHHAFPLLGSLLAAVSSGGRVVIPEGMRPPALLSSVSEGRVSYALLVPGVLRILAKAAERAGGRAAFGPALKAVVVGGAPCPMATLDACAALGVPVLQGYGMSEASPVIAVNTFEANRPGTVGRPVPGLEVRIEGEGEGEILVKGPNVMQGYYRDPERTAEVLKDGWLRTGDIGTLDVEGFLTIRGRSKNVIISESGKNVYPEEIEAELAKSGLLKESCVVGKSVEGTERIVAVVVPFKPMSPGELKAEVDACCASLADFKRVQEVVAWEGELPKTASGKVRTAAVRESLA